PGAVRSRRHDHHADLQDLPGRLRRRRQPGLRRRRERAAADAGGGRDLPAVPLRRAPRLLRGRLMRPRNAWLTHALLIVACFVVMAPVLFALIKATQSYSDVLSPSLVPGRELLDNI